MINLTFETFKEIIDDDDEDDELFLYDGSLTKGNLSHFQPGPLSEISIIENL